MFKSYLVTASYCLITTISLAAADYTAQPLSDRQPAPAGQKLFQVLSPEETGVTVPNVFDDPRMWGARFRELTLGAVETGIVVADFDRDGHPDIFAVSKNGACALYRQVAPFKFVDVARTAGVACDEPGTSKTGATAVDINHDGWPDLYVCRYGAPNLLFINNRDGTFTERAKEYGLDINDASVHASFADYDRDGYVDCYLVTNVLDFSRSPQGRRDYLFHNDGHGHFTDVTAKAGIWGLTQGHTAVWFDANNDGWPDLYVANDFETPDRLYFNRGDGTFADGVDERLPHVTYFSMGADTGDLNNDGLIDFFITDMRDRSHAQFMAGMEEIGRGLWEIDRVNELTPQYMWNAVYLNTGTDHFAEIAHLTGMDATGWTWSVRLGDLDNDGKLDAFFTTGMIRNFIDADLVDKQNAAPTLNARANVWKNAAPRHETTLAYHNLGDLKFENVSKAWGLDHDGVSFGCALVDLDGDGDLDIVYANYNAPPTIVRNNSTNGHRILIKLAGRDANPDGIGTEIKIKTASGWQVRQLYTERGVVASEPPIVHFGLGNETTIEQMLIHWPRGQVQTLENLPVDQFFTITEPPRQSDQKLAPAKLNASPAPDALFTESAAAHNLKHSNTVRPFDELAHQRLLPRRLNGLGPGLAAADVDGDGIDDLFVTGTAGQTGALFLGRPDGAFTLAPEQPATAASDTDNVNAAFLDVNGDGHPDLLLVAGGVQHNEGDPLFTDHVYLNDGHGHFTLAPEGTLPATGESKCAVAVADYDGDGKPDLFLGGRVRPGKYPDIPQSFLYHNENGKFVDVTDQVAPGLRKIGMVTAAAWVDLDGDQRPDLVLTLEWGSLVYFHNSGHGFENWTEQSGLAATTGWWSALAVADVNGDGRPDLVAGNVGLNTKYKATVAEPTVLFAGDFDGSGREALLEAQYEDGKLYPLRGRSKLASAFPWLAKKFPTYKAYGQATVEELFDIQRLNTARKLTANTLESGIFVQQPDHTFKFEPLPRLAQIAPINAIVAQDLDGDGQLDLFCAGNNFGPEPNTGRFDGGVGLLLKGDGQGHFSPMLPAQSGLVIPGETRAAIPITLGRTKSSALVIARCEGPLLLFTHQANH